MTTLRSKKAVGAPALPLLPFVSAGLEGVSGGVDLCPYAALWQSWQAYLRSRVLAPEDVEGHGAVCVWLERPVEEAVDAAWARSPSEGYALHCLALELCMAAVRVLAPRIGGKEAGCAPVPALCREQRAELADCGLLRGKMENETSPISAQPCGQAEQGGPAAPVLLRRYAVLTWYPFRGGCTVCLLREDCAGI